MFLLFPQYYFLAYIYSAENGLHYRFDEYCGVPNCPWGSSLVAEGTFHTMAEIDDEIATRYGEISFIE